MSGALVLSLLEPQIMSSHLGSSKIEQTFNQAWNVFVKDITQHVDEYWAALGFTSEEDITVQGRNIAKFASYTD